MDEPTLRLAVLADFSNGGGEKPRPLSVSQELDDTLRRIGPSLHLRASLGGVVTDIELRFERMRDFEPDGVAAQVPALAALVELRGLLSRLAKGEIEVSAVLGHARRVLSGATLAELERAIGEAPSQPTSAALPVETRSEPSPNAASVDSILDLVADPVAPAPATTEAARRAVDALTSKGSGLPRTSLGVSEAGEILDRELGAGLDAILHTPEFRALERRWRGLELLVERTDFRKAISIDLVDTTIDESPEAIHSLAAEEEPDIIVLDHAFDSSARDLERVRSLGEAASEIQVPLITAIGADFLGLGSWVDLADARAPFATFDEPEYDAWRSLRHDEASRWVVLLANRLALRGAYGPDGRRSRQVSYTEGANGCGGEVGLFGSPVWGLASVLTRSFARSGACLQISGTRNGLIPDLALIDTGKSRPAPVEAVLTDQRREDLERIGVSVVQQYQRDIAFLGALRTFRMPDRYPDAEASADSAQQVTLAYQIYASRFVRFLGRQVPQLIGIGGHEEVAASLRTAVVQYLSTPKTPLAPDRIGIEATTSPDDAALTEIALRVQPETLIGGRPVNVMLRFAVRL